MKDLKDLKLIVGVKAINTAIVGVVRSASAMQDKIHLVATSCLAHAEQHGDLTLLARLVYALPKGVKVNALKDWARAFGPVHFDDANSKCKLDKGENAREWDVDTAQITPFYAFKPEKAVAELTLQAIVDYLAKKAKAKDGDSAEVAEVRKQIAQIATFASALAAPVSPTMQDAVNAGGTLKQAA